MDHPRARSDTFVDKPYKKGGIDDELPEPGVEGGARLGRHGLVARAPLLLERGDVVADGDEHVAEFAELTPGADGLAVAGDDDGVVVGRSEIGVRGRDHSVDAAAGRMIE